MQYSPFSNNTTARGWWVVLLPVACMHFLLCLKIVNCLPLPLFFSFAIDGRHLAWTCQTSRKLEHKDTGCLSSRLSFQGWFYSEQSWKLEFFFLQRNEQVSLLSEIMKVMFLFGAKEGFAYSPLWKIWFPKLQGPRLGWKCTAWAAFNWGAPKWLWGVSERNQYSHDTHAAFCPIRNSLLSLTKECHVFRQQPQNYVKPTWSFISVVNLGRFMIFDSH